MWEIRLKKAIKAISSNHKRKVQAYRMIQLIKKIRGINKYQALEIFKIIGISTSALFSSANLYNQDQDQDQVKSTSKNLMNTNKIMYKIGQEADNNNIQIKLNNWDQETKSTIFPTYYKRLPVKYNMKGRSYNRNSIKEIKGQSNRNKEIRAEIPTLINKNEKD